MTPYDEFRRACVSEIIDQGRNTELREMSRQWMALANMGKYSYHFEWMGRPIIQYPQDIVALQEIIFQVRPDLIIETGVAHGGSLVFSASMLALLDLSDAMQRGEMLVRGQSSRKVVGVDIDIRDHNRRALETHTMAPWIQLIEGSSTSPGVVNSIHRFAAQHSSVLVLLDSNHTHDHVLAELEAYAPLVSIGSFCVVYDTVIDDLPDDAFPDRPWGVGDNPKSAVHAFLRGRDDFAIDASIPDKLLVTVAPDGYLKRLY